MLHRFSNVFPVILLFFSCATTQTDLALSISQGSVEKEYHFPDSILDFERSSTDNYENETEGGGYGISYDNPNIAIITLYFYDEGNMIIPKDINSEIILNSLKTSVNSIKRSWGEKGWSSTKDNSACIREIAEHQFWEYCTTLNKDQKKRPSFLLVTSLRNAIFKIRITFCDCDLGKTHVLELYDSILDEIAEKVVRPNKSLYQTS